MDIQITVVGKLPSGKFIDRTFTQDDLDDALDYVYRLQDILLGEADDDEDEFEEE